MNLRVAIQMDPPSTMKYATDTTLRLALEAERRGYTVWVYTPDKLTLKDGAITAHAERTSFHDNAAHMFDVHESARLDLTQMDVVLLRQDPPFDMAYLSTTYVLERLTSPSPSQGEGGGRKVLVTNDPASVRNHPEKLFPTVFKQFMPPTLVTADSAEIAAFRREFKDIVIKPLYGYAGHDVVRVKPDDPYPHPFLNPHPNPLPKRERELLTSPSPSQGEGRDEGAFKLREPVMVQPFLPEVKTGDRRIILINGELGGIMARIPAEEDFRANFRVGGHPEKAEITPRQREICEALRPEMKRLGIVLAGIDCIGDYLTEINVTSPTGIPAMNRLYGLRLESTVWDAIEARL
ncbi:MAG: glutathione synthase [Alphaproteobacteria bacterium]|nr:glutathione synthase [Alphaproteobacteria bacterium]